MPPNKPIVGDNAFAHEAGIHQDGVLKNKLTYEIMKPEDIGIPSNKLVLGKHSGRHAFINRLQELGVDTATIDVQKAFAAFKELCDKKKIVYDDDILALVNEGSRRTADTFELVDLRVTSSTKTSRSAEVTMRVDGEERSAESTGDGMVDACYKAIYKIAGFNPDARALLGQGDYRRYRRARRSVVPGARRWDDGGRAGRAQRYRDGECARAGECT